MSDAAQSSEPQSHGSSPMATPTPLEDLHLPLMLLQATSARKLIILSAWKLQEWATITIIVRSILEIIFLLIQALSCCASEDAQLLSPEG